MLKSLRGSLWLVVFSFSCKLFSGFEFLYPVQNLADDFFLVLYQKSLTDLEVWVFDSNSLAGYKELSAFFFPSCVSLLPDKSGFSFIDRGKVRIKYFDKRAVHTVPMPDSLARVTFMAWIDSNSFYVTALNCKEYKTYLCALAQDQVDIMCLQNNQSGHFLYPTIFDNSLFCVQKAIDDNYRIVQKDLSDIKNELLNILYINNDPICNLQVIKELNQAFFGTTATKSQDSELIHFNYSSLDLTSLQSEYLFSFELPKALITGFAEQRVFESVAPFLPQVTKDGIYFSSANPYCKLYFYGFETKQINELLPIQNINQNVHLFAPRTSDKKIICGLGAEGIELVNQDTSIGMLFTLK